MLTVLQTKVTEAILTIKENKERPLMTGISQITGIDYFGLDQIIRRLIALDLIKVRKIGQRRVFSVNHAKYAKALITERRSYTRPHRDTPTQEEMAKKLGIKRSTYAMRLKHERDKRNQ